MTGWARLIVVGNGLLLIGLGLWEPTRQVAAYGSVPLVCWLIYRLARWADRQGLWHPGQGYAQGRQWGDRW